MARPSMRSAVVEGAPGVRLSLGLLFGLAVTLSRRDGLSWNRAIVAGVVIILVTVVVIWLEGQVH